MERQRGFIRRGLITAVAAAGLATSGAGLVVAAHPAGAGPSGHAITDYTVFGTTSVHIGFESTVTGLVGSVNNRVAPAPNPSEALHLSGGAHIVGDARIVE